jgi:hypothetical protein
MLPGGELRTLLKTSSWVFRSRQGRNFSQLSQGLTGPDGTTASIPDIWQDPDPSDMDSGVLPGARH